MRRLLAGLTLVLIATAGRAAPVQSAVWGVEVFGGWNSFAMGAFNDSLESLNQAVGSNFKKIESGVSGGLAVRMWASDQLLLRLEFEVMAASTDADSGVTFDIGPGIATVSGTYFFQTGAGPRFGVGGGISSYSIMGELKGPGGKFKTSGTGFGLHGKGEVLVPFAGNWSLSGIVGYRYAKVDDIKVDTGTDTQGTGTEADFSGVMLRLGVAYDWKPAP